ncbi:kinase-like protein [Wolfiporia cocos MD-104 SS10]|uniref:Kinase-like protein n=1 Tax=Wolfiporia cocos (strain MD-104) TaxID=742152 RepID=A0A2H3JH09_WOLCO|nr:kinase-like protein [Wolfiporia cocos MD-104 SS10]
MPTHKQAIRRASPEDSDSDSTATSSSSDSSFDEDAVNARLSPNWCCYRAIIGKWGFRLDTCRDVKRFYQRYWDGLVAQGCTISESDWPGYLRACNGGGDDDLCKDAGLPDNLFRGSRCSDGAQVVIKAVNIRSREYEIVRYLSSPALRKHPMNHCIPVLAFIEVPQDNVVFIVMEEWSPHLESDPPFTLRAFLNTLRQHLEHLTFMHAHHVVHLDICLRNILTNNENRYGCIDFENSRRFDETPSPRILGHRGAETPPEVERGQWSDPYKIDIWASGILMLRASTLTGYEVPEMWHVLRPMLHDDHARRPTAREALKAFNAMVHAIGNERLDSCHP